MKYLLLALVLIAACAVGLAVGGGFGSFIREDKFDNRKKHYLDEAPDIQSNMHAEEE